jgi:hypothetical protein
MPIIRMISRWQDSEDDKFVHNATRLKAIWSRHGATTGQVVATNAAHAVRAPKHVVKTGKTTVLDAEQARKTAGQHRHVNRGRAARSGVNQRDDLRLCSHWGAVRFDDNVTSFEAYLRSSASARQIMTARSPDLSAYCSFGRILAQALTEPTRRCGISDEQKQLLPPTPESQSRLLDDQSSQ